MSSIATLRSVHLKYWISCDPGLTEVKIADGQVLKVNRTEGGGLK